MANKTRKSAYHTILYRVSTSLQSCEAFTLLFKAPLNNEWDEMKKIKEMLKYLIKTDK